MDNQLTDVTNSPAEKSSTHQHSEGEHHHHSDSSHHHHRHHHHHHSGKHHKLSLKNIKKSFKSFFSKSHNSDAKRYEPQSLRILKKALILILIVVLFFSSFYILIIEKFAYNSSKNTEKQLSETEILNNQLEEAQEQIKALEEELDSYKKAFGELNPGAKK